MRSTLVLASAGALLACANLVGITDLPGSGGDAGSDAFNPDAPQGPCENATTLVETTDTLDELLVSNGYAYARVSSSAGPTGVMRCATGGTCTQVSTLTSVPSTSTFQEYGAGALLYYSLTGDSDPDAGTLHSAALDGTGDQTVLHASYPLRVAVAGSRVFWAQDWLTGTMGAETTPSVVHCYGCQGATTDTVWMTNLNATYSVFADGAFAYVLADDDPQSASFGVYGCATSAPCNASPLTIATGLLNTIVPAMVTSDGAAVYVASPSPTTNIARYAVGGGSSVLYTLPAPANAIAVDGSSGDLFYADSTSKVFRGSTTGAQATLLTRCAASVTVKQLAYDATSVYVLGATSNGTQLGTAIYAVHR